MKQRFGTSLAAAWLTLALASATCPATAETASPLTRAGSGSGHREAQTLNASGRAQSKDRSCQEKKFGARNSGTFGFPGDCGAGGSIGVPSFYQSGSSSEFGMNDFFCESPQSIYGFGKSKFCYGEGSPWGHCTQAYATFWFLEVGFHARTLDGYGGEYISFNSNIFPISFSSSTYVVPGNKYGLCILAGGGTMQDDFANGTAVSPNGNTINMTMVLAPQYVSFWGGEGFTIYLEAAPAGSPS